MIAIHVRRYDDGVLCADSWPSSLRKDAETLVAQGGVLVDAEGSSVPVRFILDVLSVGARTPSEIRKDSLDLQAAVTRIEDDQVDGKIAYGGYHYGRTMMTWVVEDGEPGFFIRDPENLAAGLTIAGLAPGEQAPYRLAALEDAPQPE